MEQKLGDKAVMLHRSFHDFANLCSGGGGTAIDAKELTKATLANAM